MLTYFGENITTNNFHKSVGLYGTTLKKVVTTETWFTADIDHKHDPEESRDHTFIHFRCSFVCPNEP